MSGAYKACSIATTNSIRRSIIAADAGRIKLRATTFTFGLKLELTLHNDSYDHLYTERVAQFLALLHLNCWRLQNVLTLMTKGNKVAAASV